MILLALFGAMLIIMLMRIFLPIGAKVGGERVGVVQLSFRERLLMQRVNVYAIGAVLLLTALSGLVAPIWELLVIAVAFLILMLPVKYVITSQGIAVNNVVFRPWSDFIAVQPNRRKVRLVPKSGLLPFDLHVLSHRQQDALAMLHRYVAAPDGSEATLPKAEKTHAGRRSSGRKHRRLRHKTASKEV